MTNLVPGPAHLPVRQVVLGPSCMQLAELICKLTSDQPREQAAVVLRYLTESRDSEARNNGSMVQHVLIKQRGALACIAEY